MPLYGELTDGGSHSLHLRPSEGGSWRLIAFREDEGDEYLVERIGVLGEGVGHLHYNIYWQVDEHGSRRIAARFVGFS